MAVGCGVFLLSHDLPFFSIQVQGALQKLRRILVGLGGGLQVAILQTIGRCFKDLYYQLVEWHSG